MKSTESKNPLSSVVLGSYDLTDKGLFTENLQILSALKTAQRRFSKRILSLHPDQGNCFSTRSAERGMCGRWIFFRRFDTGDRAFAGGFYCGSHFCIPCQFRKAYTAAVSCHQFVVEQMRRNPSLVPVFHIDELFSQSGLSDQFKELKQLYRKELRRRPHLRPCISGSLGFYHFGVCADCSEWHLSCRELILADSSHASFDHQLSALRVPDQLLFRCIFDLFLCNIINADGMFSRERQFDAMQLTKDMALFVPYRSFTGFSVPENSSSDVVPAHLANLPFVEEQYHYDRSLAEYVLENINTGDDMQFPFDGYQKPGHTGGGKRARRAAARRSVFSFAAVLLALALVFSASSGRSQSFDSEADFRKRAPLISCWRLEHDPQGREVYAITDYCSSLAGDKCFRHDKEGNLVPVDRCTEQHPFPEVDHAVRASSSVR